MTKVHSMYTVNITISGIYLTFIMAMTAASIVIFVVVLNLHHRDPNAPVPMWLKWLAYDVMAPLVCMTSHRVRPGPGVYQMCEFTRDFARSVPHHEENNHTDESTLSSRLDDESICEQVSYLMKNPVKRKALLEEIIKHLRQITAKIKETDDQDLLKAEWKAVAKILDRFFLIIFVCVVVISSIVILFIYPTMVQESKADAAGLTLQ